MPGGRIKIATGRSRSRTRSRSTCATTARTNKAFLEVRGIIGLSGLTPESWGVQIQGKIAGKMLSAIAPTKIAQASGLALIDASLGGSCVAVHQRDAAVHARGRQGAHAAADDPAARREIRDRNARGRRADQDDASRRSSHVHDRFLRRATDRVDQRRRHGQQHPRQCRLTDGTLERADIGLDAENIPYRKSGVFDLIVSAKNIGLVLPGPSSVWQASGSVSIVNGSYRRDFELAEAIKPAPDLVAPAKPWWDEYPTIGNAELELLVEVRKFSVEQHREHRARRSASAGRWLASRTSRLRRDPRATRRVQAASDAREVHADVRLDRLRRERARQ